MNQFQCLIHAMAVRYNISYLKLTLSPTQIPDDSATLPGEHQRTLAYLANPGFS